VQVRRSASQALSSALGRDVTSLVHLDDAQRRREVRRLASPEALEQLPRFVGAAQRVPAPAAPVRAPAPAAPKVAQVAAVAVKRSAVAVLEADRTVHAVVLTELRAAIRGKTLAELQAAAGASSEATLGACTVLMSEGAILRRGLKYFVA
jgi:hypothetical protein